MLREHGDEMKAQVTESFAADKLKEAEAKASGEVLNHLGENAGQEVCVKKPVDLKWEFIPFAMLE